MLEANLNFLRLLSKIRFPFLDALMLIITEFGSEIIIFGIVCLLYWCVNKKTAYKIGLIFFTSGILVQGLKVSFGIERPWVLDPTFKPVAAALPKATGYSFPSGHTQGGTAMYGALFTVFPQKKLKILCAVMIFLVAFSRLYLGVHTPLDVSVSFLLTLACIALCCYLIDRSERGNSRDIALCITLAAVAVALCLYSYILSLVGVADAAQINDCFKSGGAGLAFALGMYLEKNHLNFDTRTNKKRMQAVKLAVGIGGALVLKSGLKLIAPGNLILDFLRYFLTVMWILYIYPLLFTRILNRPKKKKTA